MKKYLLLIIIISPLLIFSQIDIAAHNRAIELINESIYFNDEGEFEKSIVNLSEAIQLDSTLRNAYTLLNRALYETDKLSLQKEYLRKAKLVFIDDDEFFYYMGKTYQEEDKYLDAINEFSQALILGEEYKDDNMVYYEYYASRGACYLFLNKYEDALADFNQVLIWNEYRAGVHVNKGIALFKLKRKSEACASWEIAKELGYLSVQAYLDNNCNK